MEIFTYLIARFGGDVGIVLEIRRRDLVRAFDDMLCALDITDHFVVENAGTDTIAIMQACNGNVVDTIERAVVFRDSREYVRH